MSLPRHRRGRAAGVRRRPPRRGPRHRGPGASRPPPRGDPAARAVRAATRMSCAAALAVVDLPARRSDHAELQRRRCADRLNRPVYGHWLRRAASVVLLLAAGWSGHVLYQGLLDGSAAAAGRRGRPGARGVRRRSPASGRADRGLADRDGGLVLAPARRRGSRSPRCVRSACVWSAGGCCPATIRRSPS